MKPIPLLILGDAASAQTGLARILRDLAVRIHANMSDVYEVASLGYGGCGSRSIPFREYFIPEMHNWIVSTIREVWEDFAGDRRGIVLCVWDATRLGWFARPDNPEFKCPPQLKEWLKDPPFEKWIYAPMDALHPNHRLTYSITECLRGFDRVLAYSKWAENAIRASLPDIEGLTALPHGIDTSLFYPRPASRDIFHREMGFNGPEIRSEEKIIGVVATNQTRKDWALAFETVAKLVQDMPVRLYIQIDALERYWSIPSLVMDYGLHYHCIVNTAVIPDDMMARIYSTCDLTLGIGPEGFGYPVFESLACGTPVLTGNYGGQAEWLQNDKDHTHILARPKAYRLEGIYNLVRPVYEPEGWAYHAAKILKERKTGRSLLPSELDWKNNWPRWEKWFRSGQTLHTPDQAPAHHDSIPEMDMAKSDQSTWTFVSPVDPSDDLGAQVAALRALEFERKRSRTAPER